MRTIKVRAWHTKMNKMFSAEEMGVDQMTLSPDGRGFVNVSGADTRLSVFMGDVMIPLEWTGLVDKNGKEIYEGDLLKLTGNNVLACVAWIDFMSGFFAKLPKTEGDEDGDIHPVARLSKDQEEDMEIVGNIYENVELIK